MADIWYSNHGSLLTLGARLVDNGELSTPDDVLDFFEKPWKWQQEWEAYCAEVDAVIAEHQMAFSDS